MDLVGDANVNAEIHEIQPQEDASQTTESLGFLSDSILSEYFEYETYVNNGKKPTARKFICKLCTYKKNSLSTGTKSNFNLKAHLQRMHLTQFVEYQRKSKENERSKQELGEPRAKKKLRREVTLCTGCKKPIPQEVLNNVIATFIIDDMQPFSIVENKSFKILLEKASKQSIPGRKIMKTIIDTQFQNMFLKLKEMFDSVKFLCITTDIWSCRNRSYLGITIHWINPNNFNRESAALACRRLIGNHTHEAIAAAIEEILAKYVILLPKITMAVTDNGSNFVKAFSEYGKEFNDNNSSTTVNIQVEENSDGEDLDDESTHVQQISISKILDAVNADEESSNYYLPPHFRCAAHTMNLIATKDADKSLQANTRYKKYLRSGFAKATVLWNKYSRSPLAADTIYEITGCALIVLCVTRWNSWFDAVKKIRSISEPNLEKLCIQMNIGLFNRNEFDTMDEYIKVMECMVRALDILQGDQHCFLSILLPTIITIQDFLKSVQPSLVYAIPLVNALLDGLHKRFNIYFDKPQFILASISHPLFKLAWLESSTKIREAQNLLKTEVLKHQHLYEESTSSSCNSSTVKANEYNGDFFHKFYAQVPTSVAKTEAINEMEQYLLDCGKTVCSLEKYRIMKQIFLRYNTALTSSAPVERLFSGGKLILSATRNRLTDSHFEKLLLLNKNQLFL